MRQTSCVRIISVPPRAQAWNEDQIADFGLQCAPGAHRFLRLVSGSSFCCGRGWPDGQHALSLCFSPALFDATPLLRRCRPPRSQVMMPKGLSAYGMPPPPLPPPRRVFHTLVISSSEAVALLDLRLEPPCADGVRRHLRSNACQSVTDLRGLKIC